MEMALPNILNGKKVKVVQTVFFNILRVFLTGHSVAMVTYCVTKLIPTCLPMIGQFSDTMIVALSDKDW